MTHEEKAREIALWLYGPDEGMSEGLVRTLIDKITEAIASAEKKGREEERKRIDDFLKRYEAVMSKFDLFYAHELEDTIDCLEVRAQEYEEKKDMCLNGWNEAISAAVKVAMEYDPTYGVGESIASKIEALRKG